MVRVGTLSYVWRLSARKKISRITVGYFMLLLCFAGRKGSFSFYWESTREDMEIALGVDSRSRRRHENELEAVGLLSVTTRRGITGSSFYRLNIHVPEDENMAERLDLEVNGKHKQGGAPHFTNEEKLADSGHQTAKTGQKQVKTHKNPLENSQNPGSGETGRSAPLATSIRLVDLKSKIPRDLYLSLNLGRTSPVPSKGSLSSPRGGERGRSAGTDSQEIRERVLGVCKEVFAVIPAEECSDRTVPAKKYFPKLEKLSERVGSVTEYAQWFLDHKLHAPRSTLTWGWGLFLHPPMIQEFGRVRVAEAEKQKSMDSWGSLSPEERKARKEAQSKRLAEDKRIRKANQKKREEKT